MAHLGFSQAHQSAILSAPLDIMRADPDAVFQVERSGQPVDVYECRALSQEPGVPCGMFIEGTTPAISSHLRVLHGIAGADDVRVSCTWAGCSKDLKRGSMARHILTHLGVKVRCSTCGVVKCRDDILRAHINSTQACASAPTFIQIVEGSERRILVPTFMLGILPFLQ